MKKTFTLNILAGSKKTIVLSIAGMLFVVSLVLAGCYAFRSINQPSEGLPNSYFDVPIIVERDKDPGSDDGSWTGALQSTGLFGVMIPDGWTVDDNIPYTIISKGAGLNNSGILIYDAAHSKVLTDSVAPIPGYHWWGAITDRIADMNQFDSLYFTPRIHTDSKTGTFFLRYAVGDKDYWDRNPADQYNYGGGLSDPISIVISNNVGLPDLLSKANVSMYPNPTHGDLHVTIGGYKSQVIKMNIYDSKGQVVLTKEILKSSNIISLSSLPKGAYTVELKNGNKKFNSRIVVN
jgi:uncharacterized protein YceK